LSQVDDLANEKRLLLRDIKYIREAIEDIVEEDKLRQKNLLKDFKHGATRGQSASGHGPHTDTVSVSFS
jgi:predicted DNA-binding protein